MLFTLLLFVVVSYVNPEPLVGSLTVGPAPFEELNPQVKLFTANHASLGNLSSKAQTTICGVYLCENPSFRGQLLPGLLSTNRCHIPRYILGLPNQLSWLGSWSPSGC